jgi:hypothetical protein
MHLKICIYPKTNNLSYSFGQGNLTEGEGSVRLTSSKLFKLYLNFKPLNFGFPCTCCVDTQNEVNVDFVKCHSSMIMSTEKCSLLYSM